MKEYSMENQTHPLQTGFYVFTCFLALSVTVRARELPEDPVLGPVHRTLGAWQNPNFGFAFDMVADISDIEEDKWTSKEINIRSAELDVNANIDSFGELHQSAADNQF